MTVNGIYLTSEHRSFSLISSASHFVPHGNSPVVDKVPSREEENRRSPRPVTHGLEEEGRQQSYLKPLTYRLVERKRQTNTRYWSKAVIKILMMLLLTSGGFSKDLEVFFS